MADDSEGCCESIELLFAMIGALESTLPRSKELRGKWLMVFSHESKLETRCFLKVFVLNDYLGNSFRHGNGGKL